MPRQNLVQNPSWEVGGGRWVYTVSGGGTLDTLYLPGRESSPMTPQAGTQYAFIRRTTAGRLNIAEATYRTVTPGTQYAASIYINRDGTGSGTLDIDWYSGNGTGYISSSTGTLNPASGVWGRISIVGTAPAGATTCRMFLHFDNMLANNFVRFDAALFEQSSTVGSYFDGSFSGFEWDGTAHDSTSSEITNTAPVANAGADQTGKTSGQTVTLSGSATDAEGGTLSYAWTVQSAGTSGLTNASLSNRLTSTATFTVPTVSTNTTVTFRLTVTDSGGLSDTDDMTVGIIALRSGIGLAKLGLKSNTAGSKSTTGLGSAKFGLKSNTTGSKRTSGTAQSAAIGLGLRTTGLKRGIGTHQTEGIGISTWGSTPRSVPIFTGRPLSEDPLPMAQTRYLVQNALTGAWLHTDLPLAEDQVTLTLSGPTQITGKITSEMADLRTDDGKPLLRSWGHVVYLEMDGDIRAAGLVTEDSYDDQTQTLTCTGVSSYPNLVPFMDVYVRYNIDPLQVVQDMWSHVQGFQNSNMGVTVQRLGNSPTRLGINPKQEPSQARGFLSDGSAPDPAMVQVKRSSVTEAVWNRLLALGYLPRATDVAAGIEARYVLPEVLAKAKDDVAKGFVHTSKDTEIEPFSVNIWDAKPCGDVINDAIKACPADYVEQFAWNNPRSFVNQSVLVAFPRVGRRRDDLRFVTGENIMEPPELAFDAAGYATCVFGIGAGEGSQALRSTAEVVIPGVLRKVFVYRNPKITDRKELDRIVSQELTKRSGFDGQEITSITVQASHVNAPFGAYNVGDDIYTQAYVPHWGWIRQWGRITQMTLDRESDLVQIELRRSDSFFYGREVPE